MTPRQAQALHTIIAWSDKGAGAPGYKDIAAALGFTSKSHAFRIVDGLIERGYVAREGGRYRNHGLVVTPAGFAAVRGTVLARYSDDELRNELAMRSLAALTTSLRGSFDRLADLPVRP